MELLLDMGKLSLLSERQRACMTSTDCQLQHLGKLMDLLILTFSFDESAVIRSAVLPETAGPHLHIHSGEQLQQCREQKQVHLTAYSACFCSRSAMSGKAALACGLLNVWYAAAYFFCSWINMEIDSETEM